MRLNGKLWNEAHRAHLAALTVAYAQRREGRECADAIRAIHDEMAALTRRNPHYLARRLSNEAKCEAARFHYDWLLERLTAAGVHDLLTGRVALWSAEREGGCVKATVTVEHNLAREGELSIELFVDRDAVYSLSFTALPGRLAGLAAGETLLVSRLQGWAEKFEQIRQATKTLSDVAPPAALFAALAGIAQAAGIRHAAGVSGDNSIAYDESRREALERQYDAFFQSLDAAGPTDGFYGVDLRAEPKPVNAQKAGHRIRTRRKRQLKSEIAAAAAQAFARLLDPDATGGEGQEIGDR